MINLPLSVFLLRSSFLALVLLTAGFATAEEHVWSNHFGGPDAEYAYGLSTNTAGELAITGYFYDTLDLGNGDLTSAGASDIYIGRYDADGNHA